MGNIELAKKSLSKRIFFLNQAQERAQDPTMKQLWESKKEELMKLYLEQR
jgi:hypothetical protein